MFELPTYREIGGKTYKIRNDGDFRMVLDCFDVFNDFELDDADKVLSSLIIFYEDISGEEDIPIVFGDNIKEAAEKMVDFFNCDGTAPGSKHNHKLVDWKADSQLIASAINKVAGTEVRALPYLHWWTFMGYYSSVGHCVWNTVVGIRYKMKTGKKLEKDEQEFRRDNPEYFIWDSRTPEDKLAEEELQNLWNTGGEISG